MGFAIDYLWHCRFPRERGLLPYYFCVRKVGEERESLYVLNSRAMEWELKKWGDEIQWWHRLLNERKEMVGP